MEEIELLKAKMQLWVLKVMALTLASVMVSVVVVLMIGLFLPNEQIDNNEIFKIIGPAFSMVIGAFVGSFATMMGMKTEPLDPNIKLQELGTSDHLKNAQAHTENAKAESIETDNQIKLMAAIDQYHQSDEDHGPF